VAVGVEREADSIAISPGLSRKNLDLSGHSHSASFQGLAQHSLLDLKLRIIAGVLILAPAAWAEVGAIRIYAFLRGGYKFLDLRGGEAALFFDDSHTGLFAGQSKRNKHGLALVAGQECAAVDGLFDLDD
jgi:hypothetical protein